VRDALVDGARADIIGVPSGTINRTVWMGQ